MYSGQSPADIDENGRGSTIGFLSTLPALPGHDLYRQVVADFFYRLRQTVSIALLLIMFCLALKNSKSLAVRPDAQLISAGSASVDFCYILL